MQFSLTQLQFLQEGTVIEKLQAFLKNSGDKTRLENQTYKEYNIEQRVAFFEYLKLIPKLTKKFDSETFLACDPLAYEQSSHIKIARYKANLLKNCSVIADLCCGMGADGFALQDKEKVYGVDLDPCRLWMREQNAKALKLPFEQIQQDVCTFDKPVHAILIDPARRNEAEKDKSWNPDDLQPSWSQIKEILKIYPNALIKLSPAFPEEYIDIPCERHYLGLGDECRELLLVTGNLMEMAGKVVTANLLTQKAITYDSKNPIPKLPVNTLGAYIYEPLKSAIRSNAFVKIAHEHQLWQIDEKMAYLSSAEAVNHSFLKGYVILDHSNKNLKQIKKMLQKHQISELTIKKRGINIIPEQEMKQFSYLKKKKLASNPGILIYTRIDSSPIVILTKLL